MMPKDAHQQWKKLNSGVGWTNHVVGATQKLRYGQLDDLGEVVARSGREVGFERLGAAGKGLGLLGNVVNVSVCSKAQWDRDKEERPGMGAVEHGTRCAYRGAVVGGAGALGGGAGTAAGSALAVSLAGAYSAFMAGAAAGTAVAPGPGTVVCAVVGGIVGGVVAGMGASKVADVLVDDTIDDVGSGATAAADHLKKRLSAVRTRFSR
ncbi:hypothetical protein [Streptomyces sp. HUAS TT7]|uniref:hypothetical protein n=1 Tax=Streptomyces sp. HUAS TT7 TaxID=3447507 RepID=UPI003F657DA4